MRTLWVRALVSLSGVVIIVVGMVLAFHRVVASYEPVAGTLGSSLRSCGSAFAPRALPFEPGGDPLAYGGRPYLVVDHVQSCSDARFPFLLASLTLLAVGFAFILAAVILAAGRGMDRRPRRSALVETSPG